MRNFWKGAGRVAALLLGAKVIAEIVKSCNKRNTSPEPKKNRELTNAKKTVDRTDSKYISNQLVVWKRTGVSDEAFTTWKSKNIEKFVNIARTKSCDSCDSSLELWEGDDVPTFISGQVASGGTTTTTKVRGGGDDVVYYTYNLIIDLPEPHLCESYQKEIRLPDQSNAADPAVIVAVFDTGVSSLIKNAYTFPVPSCMPGGQLGWNFAYGNDTTEDDHPHMHGSAVAKFIIDQADKYRIHKINILPVKIHNKDGKSDLFSILCGFAYAANCGAKIINASFGFYAAKDSNPPLILAEFVKKYLTDKNILLVCAAGNVDADKLIGRTQTESIRNLDVYPFYPACLSKDFENVIAVTTISPQEDEVSPSQNFSNNIVDVGVRCDQQIDNDFRFEDSLKRQDAHGNPIYIIGSSYAAPIITGKAAQFYNDLISTMVGGSINKSLFIQELKNKIPKIVDTDPNTNLFEFILDGNFSVKV